MPFSNPVAPHFPPWTLDKEGIAPFVADATPPYEKDNVNTSV
jgi:hypothetical protein